MSDSSLQAEFSYVGLDWSKKSKGVQAIWRTFVSQWINNADQNVPTLLGLMVTPVNSPGQSTPSNESASGNRADQRPPTRNAILPPT